MRRRSFLAATAALCAGSCARARANGGTVWTKLAGRPGGGLPVLILAPPVAGPHPAIIFSHGIGARPQAFIPLAAPWAAAGFVVLLPEHLDSLARGAPERPDYSLLKRYALLRIGDIKAMLDALPVLTARAGTEIAADRVGFGGHSFGAWTAAAIAGARVYVGPGRAKNFADPRPRAFLLLAGPPVPRGAGAMHPFQGMANDSFADVARPLMLIDGTRDDASGADLGSYRERLAAYALSPPGNKYLGLELNGTHMTTVGLAPASNAGLKAIAARSLTDLHALSVPFWRGFVCGNAGSIAWLNGPAPFTIDSGFLRFERRLG